MHEKLYRLRDTAMKELEGMTERGMDRASIETAKNLASLVCKLDCITGQETHKEDGYSGRYSREEGYSTKRDSMGRYSRDDGYSYGGTADKLREMIDSGGLDSETKNDLHHILSRIDQRR